MKKLDWYREEMARMLDRLHVEQKRADENELRSARIEGMTIERCSRVAYVMRQTDVGDAILVLKKEVFPVVERERRSWQNAIE